jgi:hypothetical protein
MRVLSVAVAAVLCCTAGCDFEIRSNRASTVSPELLGEWTGVWHSSESTANGSVLLRVQVFEGRPVVGISIDNPCLPPRNYELIANGQSVELRAEGATVFAGEFGPGRTLIGNYVCAQDNGAWHADWQRELPRIIDVSGAWRGTVAAASVAEAALELDLEQSVVGGLVQVAGSVRLPEYVATPLPVSGTVQFREGQFDLVLATSLGVEPVLQLTAIGEMDDLSIPTGLLHAVVDPRLPFDRAIWRAARQ